MRRACVCVCNFNFLNSIFKAALLLKSILFLPLLNNIISSLKTRNHISSKYLSLHLCISTCVVFVASKFLVYSFCVKFPTYYYTISSSYSEANQIGGTCNFVINLINVLRNKTNQKKK